VDGASSVELEIEVLGRELAEGRRDLPGPDEIAKLIALAVATAGVHDGHLALAFVGAEEIAALNAEHRGKAGPTDVLSFPIDEADADVPGPRELGDIVICPEHTTDIREAIVHGALHLVGMDHETDDGEMLTLQAELLSW
jgi:probable rRNA maturation factor